MNPASIKLTRQEIVQLIFDLEEGLKPDSWVVDGIEIWPWLRVKIFFYLIKNYEFIEAEGIPNETLKISKMKRLFNGSKQLAKWFFAGRAELIFVGAQSHRGIFQNLSYNKFFDPIRLNKKSKKKALLIEYSPATRFSASPDSIVSYTEIQMLISYFFSRPAASSALKDYTDSITRYLSKRISQFPYSFSSSTVVKWSVVTRNIRIWKMLLGRLKPTKIFTLCYYSDVIYSMNLAASQLGICKYEMQHGPISSIHLAYGSFEGLLKSSRSPLLPDVFLTWEKTTAVRLQRSFPHKRIVLAGHPWMDFLNEDIPLLKKSKKVITYAMQPVGIGEIFPEFLVRWIRESSPEYEWWFRLHPRQQNEKSYIVDHAMRLLPENNWEIEQPSNLPLPLILKNSDMVFTYVSGVVLEASMIGIPAIAFHSCASDYYQQEFTDRQIYICHADDFPLSWDGLNGRLSDFFVSKNEARPKSVDVFLSLINEDGNQPVC